MLPQVYIGAILLCSVLLLVYFIWYVNLILNIHKKLETVQRGQMECVTDPMEVETVRYQMKYLYKNNMIPQTVLGLGVTLLILSILTILLGIYIQYVKSYNGLSIFPGFIILLFAVSVIATFKREPFTENRVLAEYDTKYNTMKQKVQMIVSSRYPDVSSLPEDLLDALIQRFLDYNDLHEVVKMPLYTKYETLNLLKNHLTLPDGGINVEELMKYLKFNADASRTVEGRDADGNKADIPVYLTDIDLLRPRDTRASFVNDLYGNNTMNPYETLKDSLKVHHATILVWTILFSYLLFHLLYRTYGKDGPFTTIYTAIMIVFIIVILMRLFVSDYY